MHILILSVNLFKLVLDFIHLMNGLENGAHHVLLQKWIQLILQPFKILFCLLKIKKMLLQCKRVVTAAISGCKSLSLQVIDSVVNKTSDFL